MHACMHALTGRGEEREGHAWGLHACMTTEERAARACEHAWTTEEREKGHAGVHACIGGQAHRKSLLVSLC